MDLQQEMLIKIILVGAEKTGKSWIFQQYMKQQVNNVSDPTIGVEFATKTIQVQNKIVKLQIWDTAGQVKYKALTQKHYRKAQGVLLVYNITKEQSFLYIQEEIGIVKEKTEPDCVLMLVGNYLDLVEENPTLRAVTLEKAQSLASTNKMFFFEVSANNGQQIEQTLKQLVTQIIQNMETQDKLYDEQIK